MSIRSKISAPDLALIIAVVTFLGFAFVPVKLALLELPPFALAAVRFFLAAVPAMFFVARPSMPWLDIAGYGLAIGGFQYGLLFLGIELGMPVGLASLVIQVQVFFTIGLSVLLTGDRLSRANIVGGVVAATGIAELAIYKIANGVAGTLAGFLLVVIAGFAWSVGNIIAKRAAARYHADMFALVIWSSIVPVLPLALISYLFEGGNDVASRIAHASAATWGWVLMLSWGATLFGFGSWAALLHRYSVGLITPFALLIPVSGLVCGALLLGEALTYSQLIGAALVLIGLAINILGPKWFVALRVPVR